MSDEKLVLQKRIVQLEEELTALKQQLNAAKTNAQYWFLAATEGETAAQEKFKDSR